MSHSIHDCSVCLFCDAPSIAIGRNGFTPAGLCEYHKGRLGEDFDTVEVLSPADRTTPVVDELPPTLRSGELPASAEWGVSP